MFANRFMSISTKLSLTVSLLIVLLLTVFSGVLVFRESKKMEENLQSKGKTITRNVAMTCSVALMGNDFAFLNQVTAELIKDPDIVYAIITNKNNEIIVWNPSGAKNDPELLELLHSTRGQRMTRFFSTTFGAEIYDIGVPIELLDEAWGMVRLGISLEDMKKKNRDNIYMVVFLLIATVIIGIYAVFKLGRRISKPIQQLVQNASLIAQGILDRPIEVNSNDEVGVLAHAFERMRVSLKGQITEIARQAMGLKGDLKVFALADLFQMICTNKQTGILHLTSDEHWGKIYIKSGDIYKVENSWNDDYQKAVFRFFNWSHGEFKFDRQPINVNREVEPSWEHIIMEGARHTDELERIKQVIPSEYKRIAFVENPPESVKKIKLTMDELKLSTIIQDCRTIKDVLDASPFDDLKTYKLLYGFLSAGLLKFKD
ncbi:DUF4388 domain-containing protein [bacterium]|nr:DUF4388 domain-containing protein [bacterium]